MTDQTVTLRIVADNGQAIGVLKASKAELTSLGTTATKVGNQARAGLARARELLDVKPYSTLRREMSLVQAAYNRLKSSGTASLAELAQASLRVRDRTAELRGQMNGLGRNLQAAAAPLKQFARGLAVTAGLLGGFSVIQQADAYSNLSARLNLASDSQAEFNTSQQEVFRIAQQTRQQLDAVGSLYARLSPALKEVGGTQRDVTQFTETFSKSLVVSGASAAESASATLQLSQALGAGALRGEEYNAVIEAAPRFIKALADSLGVPRGALKKLAEDGELTSDKLVKAVRFASGQIDREFAQLPQTVDGSLTQLRNALERALGERNNATGATQQIAAAIKLLADNIEPVLDAVIRLGYIAGVVFGVQLVGAAINAAKALVIYVAQLQSAITFTGLLQRATLLMVAAFVGYQIGAWARDNFEIVRNAGIYAVQSILIAKEGLVAGFDIAFARIVQAAESFRPALVLAFAAAFDRIRELAASFYDVLARSFASVGGEWAQDLSSSYADASAAIRAGGGAVAAEAASDIAAAAQKANAAVADAKKRAKDGIAQVRAITDDQLAAPLREKSASGALGPEGNIKTPPNAADLKRQAKEAKDAADALRRLNEEATALRNELYPAAAAVTLLETNLAKLKATGGSEAEFARFADVFAEDLVGGLDAGTQAVRRYEQQIAILEVLLDDGRISQERFTELVGRARSALSEVGDEAKTTRSALEDFYDLDFNRDFSAGFGEAGAALGQIVTRIDQLAKSTAEYNKARAEGKGTAEQLAKLEQDQAARQIATYADITNAAQSFFKRGSAGYKLLQATSRAFYAFELAQQAASVAVSIAASSAKAAGHATAASAAGAEAVATQATAGPYVGFALAAAMVAFLASLGVKPRGSGGGSAPSAPRVNLGQGTGTVLGDSTANSESVSRVLEQLADFAETDLAYSAGQLQVLRSIDAGIRGVGSLLFRANAATGGSTPFNFATTTADTALSRGVGSFSTGASLGLFNSVDKLLGGIPGGLISAIFGKITTKQIDSGLVIAAGQTLGSVLSDGLEATYFATIRQTRSSVLGLVRSNSTRDVTQGLSADITQQFELVLGGLNEAVINAASSLGSDPQQLARVLAAQRLDIGKISLQGLKPEEAQERLQAVFSAIGDTLAIAAIPAIAEFQQAGEGAFETLSRVASQTRIVAQRIDSLGLSLGDLGTLDVARLGQRLVDLAGGIEAFTDNTSTYYSEFFTDEEQTESLRQQLVEAVDALGYALPAARAGFRELISSLDLTSEQGQEAFTRLTALAGAADRYYDTLDDAMARYDDAAKALRNFRTSIGQISEAVSGISLVDARQRFEGVTRRARLGDIEALEALPQIGTALREVSLSQSLNRTEYLRDVARIRLGAAQAEEVATRLSGIDIASQQLAEQRAQTALLQTISESVAPDSNAQSAMLATINSALGPTTTVAPAGTTSPVEVAALRSEIAELKQMLFSITTNVEKTAKSTRWLEDWEVGGLPATRVA